MDQRLPSKNPKVFGFLVSSQEQTHHFKKLGLSVSASNELDHRHKALY
jgi:hypothetical protein